MNIKEFAEKIQGALASALNREVQLKESLRLNNIDRKSVV